MKKDTRNHPRISIGLDLGDRFSYMVAVDRKGEIVAEAAAVPEECTSGDNALHLR